MQAADAEAQKLLDACIRIGITFYQRKLCPKMLYFAALQHNTTGVVLQCLKMKHVWTKCDPDCNLLDEADELLRKSLHPDVTDEHGKTAFRILVLVRGMLGKGGAREDSALCG